MTRGLNLSAIPSENKYTHTQYTHFSIAEFDDLAQGSPAAEAGPVAGCLWLFWLVDVDQHSAPSLLLVNGNVHPCTIY